ncbi:hypothetical protein FACS1894216_11470 [Synergistales bacterium]|nr:hypothetical protein FACS1894216_11470 [Synergistales bacterium]
MNLSLSEFNWQLIGILAALSVAVSYVGDVLGMKIGKRRVSLFGLRPKYTSRVITSCTGVAVAMLTLFIAAGASPQIKAAFFGTRYLEGQITQLIQAQHENEDQLADMQFELSMAKTEVLSAAGDLKAAREKLAETQAQASAAEKERDALSAEKSRLDASVSVLREETESLKKGLAEMKEGQVIAFQGELLSQVPVERGAAPAAVNAAFERLTKTAEEALTEKYRELIGNRTVNAATKVTISNETRAAVKDELARSSGRKLLRMTAPSNAVRGSVLYGEVKIFPSSLIFKKGDVLLSGTARGGASNDGAANELYAMLRRVNRASVGKGVLPDPISGTVGNIDTIDFYEAADKISKSEGDVSVSLVAASDIYTEGPVDISIMFE